MEPLMTADEKNRRLLALKLADEVNKDIPSEARLTLLMRRLNFYQQRISGIKV